MGKDEVKDRADTPAPPRRVVVAEDEPLIRLDIVESLKEAGYDVVVAKHRQNPPSTAKPTPNDLTHPRQWVGYVVRGGLTRWGSVAAAEREHGCRGGGGRPSQSGE